MILVPAPMFRAEACDAVDFNGTSTRLTLGAGLSGIVDSKKFTLTGWIKSERLGGAAQVICRADPDRFLCYLFNKLSLIARTTTGVFILNISSLSDVTNVWRWFGISVDLADAGKRHLYFGDTDELNVTTYTNNTIDFTGTNWAVGGNSLTSLDWFDGGMADILFWPGIYVDLSVQTNRRMFYSLSGKYVDPRRQGGAISTIGPPSVYLHLNEAETPADNFSLNDDGGATGGDFTVTGALTTYASSPSD